MNNDIIPPPRGDASSPQTISAKRAAPAEITPILFEGVTYSLDTKKDKEVNSSATILNAFDNQKTLLWSLNLYTIDFNPLIETDVQEVYPVSMLIKEIQRDLLIVDERNNQYTVDLNTRKLKEN